MPFGVTTVTSTGPADSTGEVAVIDVSLLKMKDEAGTEPKLTAVAPVKPVPVMVTVSPPIVVPVIGDTAVTTGVAVFEEVTVEEPPLWKYHTPPTMIRTTIIIQTAVDVFIKIV